MSNPNPFPTTTSNAGSGTIHLALLPPNIPRLTTVNYQYPLKLVSPPPARNEDWPHNLVHTIYLLTYGGGLVAGDAIDLRIKLESTTRLILLTQGSTKLFKSPDRATISRQRMGIDIAAGAALCYLPDPVQPFERSCFEQQQIYHLAMSGTERSGTGGLCALDWVCNGRPANGENWSFHSYASKNEIYLHSTDGRRKLLLRDNMQLDERLFDKNIASRMDGLAVVGTLMLYGPLFQGLQKFFMHEFSQLPRIGGRKWDSGSDSGEEPAIDLATVRRLERQRQEEADGLLWTSASVRGCVLVKFGAKEVEHGRRWLRNMLTADSTVVREFGDRALLCLR